MVVKGAMGKAMGGGNWKHDQANAKGKTPKWLQPYLDRMAREDSPDGDVEVAGQLAQACANICCLQLLCLAWRIASCITSLFHGSQQKDQMLTNMFKTMEKVTKPECNNHLHSKPKKTEVTPGGILVGKDLSCKPCGEHKRKKVDSKEVCSLLVCLCGKQEGVPMVIFASSPALLHVRLKEGQLAM
eukprot:632252-Amphidinium_carterae.1